MIFQSSLSAESHSWVSGEVPTLVLNAEQTIENDEVYCMMQQVQIPKLPYQYTGEDEGDTSNTCVYDMGNWRYALSNRTFQYSTFNHARDVSFVIGFGHDQKMYKVNNLPQLNPPVFVPFSNDLVYKHGPSNSGWGERLVIYKDIVNKLTRDHDQSYVVDSESPDFIFKRPNGYVLPVGKVASSANGKWLVFEAIDLGIVRMNLDNYEIKRISTVAPRYGLGAHPQMSFDISDDGELVVMGGMYTPTHVYRVTPSCGDNVITDELTKDVPLSIECPFYDLGAKLNEEIAGFQAADRLKFSYDTGEISFRATMRSAQVWTNAWYTLRASGYVPIPRLDYLALGDSFSSGEGDVQTDYTKPSFYLPGTDVMGEYEIGIPEERCHVSSRSYPFLLQLDMSLSYDKMKSVACSGAQRVDVQGYSVNRQGNELYEGQAFINSVGLVTPRLSGLPNIDNLQSTSLTNFTPGRLQQLKFVKRYKPKVITLTIGGNDIGFGKILEACISKTIYLGTCSQASEEERVLLGREIRSKFTVFRDVYKSLKDASPESKIYVLGYPHFINADSIGCGANLTLNNAERRLIVEGVKYLNAVIKAAAAEAGVKYINTENSLGNNILCDDGEDYVNGLGTALFGQLQESFHPNAKGHAAMYAAIKSGFSNADETLLNHATCSDVIICPNAEQANLPVVPEYFTPSTIDYNYIASKINMVVGQASDISNQIVQSTANTVTKGVDYVAKLSSQTFRPLSVVRVELHSTPRSIGMFTADINGGLEVLFKIPSDTAVGYHTLHMYGETYSGELIDYYQSVRVQGVAGDVDEDGVADTADVCLFILPSGVDVDADGVDDACDLTIVAATTKTMPEESKGLEHANPKSRLHNPKTPKESKDGVTISSFSHKDETSLLQPSITDSILGQWTKSELANYLLNSTPYGIFTAIVYAGFKLRKM